MGALIDSKIMRDNVARENTLFLTQIGYLTSTNELNQDSITPKLTKQEPVPKIITNL